MFSASSIIDNLSIDKGLEYKKLCRLLKLSKKSEKDKLVIALDVLEKLEIINKSEVNEYTKVNDSKHLVARIRCSSKGYCFAVRDNNKEDIYIKENLLNHAWNGDKVLVRIVKDGYRRRSPEGIVDCILERSNQILLAKVEIIDDEVYGVPIDDRILSKIKLPKNDEIYKYCIDEKNIVKVKIDLFPIGQQEGKGHVVKELKLKNNEILDMDFVLSKSNLNIINKLNELEPIDIKNVERLDLSDRNSYMFKSWASENSPILPIIQIEHLKEGKINLWVHTNAIAERLALNTKKSLDIFNDCFESLPLIKDWHNYLNENIISALRFKVGEKNEAISICIQLNKNNEIINWSFHLTLVKCSLIIDNEYLKELLTRKNKKRITSTSLKGIKDHVRDLDKILEISAAFRDEQLLKGKFEISSSDNNIESLNELLVHNPGDYSKEYFEPLNINDCQTYLTPILYEANLLWFKHSKEYKIKSASYVAQDLEYINLGEIIKYSELVTADLELNEDGNLTIKQMIDLCEDKYKKKILQKLLRNHLKENQVILISDENKIFDSQKTCISPWTLPSYDFVNLMNQYNIYCLINNGKRTKKNNEKNIDIVEMDSWKNVDWNIFSESTYKNINLLFNNYTIDKINEYKNKAKQFKANMTSIKKVRKAEDLVGNIYSGFITTVQSYGFFVEIDDLNVEGLVHVSTLNNDWYEYRSRQNSLVGRKSKKSYKIGDLIKVKIDKVDILKYQIDLELV